MGDVGGIKPEQEKVELFEKVTGRDAQNGADPVTVLICEVVECMQVSSLLSTRCRAPVAED
ncbi:hypothetical protein ACYBYX_06590 [Klebsiella pneumoniae]|uniref:hypothetical protein n=1 Tax=Klebsiella pneumoniae TaxID=573 RepID=UPI0030EF2EE9